MTAAVVSLSRPGLSPLVIACLAATWLVWGSTYLAIRFALEGYPPFLLGAIRMAIAGALMYAVLRWRGAKPPTRREATSRCAPTMPLSGLK